eukprot:SAG11_NODE_15293_length_582_cov_136.552795_1_plen_58_part_01
MFHLHLILINFSSDLGRSEHQRGHGQIGRPCRRNNGGATTAAENCRGQEGAEKPQDEV